MAERNLHHLTGHNLSRLLSGLGDVFVVVEFGEEKSDEAVRRVLTPMLDRRVGSEARWLEKVLAAHRLVDSARPGSRSAFMGRLKDVVQVEDAGEEFGVAVRAAAVSAGIPITEE